MGIDLYWDNKEQTVMLCEFNGDWSWDELHAVLRTIKQLSVERGRVFGAIVDVRGGLRLPGGTIFNREALTNFRKMLQLDPEGKGPVVIVGMNPMIRTIFDTAGRLEPSVTENVYFADDMQEARRKIYTVTPPAQPEDQPAAASQSSS